MPSRAAPHSHEPALTGAVLAGGRSTRMGVAKATVQLGGRPLVTHPLDAVSAAGLEPVVVAKPGCELPSLACPVISDADPRSHPAAGIQAALEAAGGHPVVVVACDMPFVPPELLAHLSGLDAPLAVPRVGRLLQPLLARYAPSTAPALREACESDRPLRDAIAALDPLVLGEYELQRFGDPARIVFNVNDREDLALAETRLRSERIAEHR